MSKTSTRSISKDLTIGLILVVLIVSLFAMLIAHYSFKKKADTELRTKADEYTAFIKDTLVLPMWNYDFETIKAVCHTYLQNDLITGIQVRDLRHQIDINMVKDDTHPALVRTVGLFHYDIPLGEVQVSLTHGYLTKLNRQLFWSFALIILTNLVTLVVLTGIMLRMSLKRPLDRLNEIVESYAAGDYSSFVKDVPQAELRPLVDTLDQMGRKIQLHLSTIRRAEKKYRGIFENSIEGIYQSTPEGAIISANPAFARILGYDSPEQLIEEITDIAEQHWVTPKERQELVREIFEKGAVTSFETRLVRRDGQIIWVLINGQPVFDSKGSLLHIGGMAQDITHRKKAEAQLRRLSTAAEQVADGIFITNDKGLIDYVNPAFVKATGYQLSNVLGREPGYLGADAQEAAVYREIWDAIVAGENWTGRIRNIKKNGDIFIADTTVSPITSHSGRFIGCAAVIRDVTEKVLFENQIRQTQKMEAIGTLAGGIAHDFNNMLGVIIGCSELAMDGIPEDSKASADMERVLDAGLRAKALVRQILTFSRQSESELKPLLLRPFLKEVVKFLQTTLPASINIHFFQGPEDFTILADPTQLQQILLNLCTNSAHALAPEGGTIEVSLFERLVNSHEAGPVSSLPTGTYVNLIVRDNGPGIPQEHIDRVFDPFFTTKNIGEGTGLGLSVVHGIVKNHGGAVYAESIPGEGTAMQVLFPSLEHPGFNPEPDSNMVPPEGREDIFLVEDEPVLADILDRILTGLGYKVKPFSGGVDAWRYFEGNPDRFDLALLDYNMPTVTGIELSARINRLRPDLPIILYTGMGIEPLWKEARKAGIRTILNKPLNRIELAVAIREVLDGSFRHAE